MLIRIHVASPAQFYAAGEDRGVLRPGSSGALHVRHRSQLRLRQIVLQHPENGEAIRRAPRTSAFSLLLSWRPFLRGMVRSLARS